MVLANLPKNHLKKIKSVKFDFTEYKAHEKLACLPYERMMVRCANHYGADFAFKNVECRDIAKFFMECVNINQIMGELKRTQPEFFATNEYSREKPHFEELYF